MTRIISKTNVV